MSGARELPLSAASHIAEVLSVDLAWLLVGVPSDAMLRSLGAADGPTTLAAGVAIRLVPVAAARRAAPPSPCSIE